MTASVSAVGVAACGVAIALLIWVALLRPWITAPPDAPAPPKQCHVEWQFVCTAWHADRTDQCAAQAWREMDVCK